MIGESRRRGLLPQKGLVAEAQLRLVKSGKRRFRRKWFTLRRGS
jgi:hypothetical protein